MITLFFVIVVTIFVVVLFMGEPKPREPYEIPKARVMVMSSKESVRVLLGKAAVIDSPSVTLSRRVQPLQPTNRIDEDEIFIDPALPSDYFGGSDEVNDRDYCSYDGGCCD